MYDAAREADATMFGREMRDSRSNEEMLREALDVAAKADVISSALTPFVSPPIAIGARLASESTSPLEFT